MDIDYGGLQTFLDGSHVSGLAAREYGYGGDSAFFCADVSRNVYVAALDIAHIYGMAHAYGM